LFADFPPFGALSSETDMSESENSQKPAGMTQRWSSLQNGLLFGSLAIMWRRGAI
jgi:hypothetical protein